jgi:hypothetical protein
VEFDFPVTSEASTAGMGNLIIWGIDIKDVSQASDFRDKFIKMEAGMTKGLPLENANLSGIIRAGSIIKSWGNWQGLNQTLNFEIYS